MAILLITHDLGVVKQIAETVSVMHAGHIVEKAGVSSFFKTPRHPYSKELLAALPERQPQYSKGHLGAPFSGALEENPILLKVEALKVHFPLHGGKIQHAVEEVTFSLEKGEMLSIVGGSGSGKTTLGKAILKLITPTSGTVTLLTQGAFRKNIQMIFQDAYAAMNPMMQVNEIVEEGMISLKIGSNRHERQDRIFHLLEQVGLSLKIKNHYPHELSGGQRQRVAIARALAVGAKIIVCDEPTSALDLSVQGQILTLLKLLQEELGISYLFITHNMSVVRYLGGSVMVMQEGRIVEYGVTHEVLSAPQHVYTRMLLASVPFTCV